jgi:hypothetical protein
MKDYLTEVELDATFIDNTDKVNVEGMWLGIRNSSSDGLVIYGFGTARDAYKFIKDDMKKSREISAKLDDGTEVFYVESICPNVWKDSVRYGIEWEIQFVKKQKFDN